ncbi:MAG: triose-phosphate isomerase [Salinivirgaceae bacterium]|jgi:triosephosphate isomerase|nr:triose-phosphate isomerase [Salinivirgaceae bacterium]
MRKQIVAGNWKMNTTIDEATKLIEALKKDNRLAKSERDVIVAPPYTHIHHVQKLAAGTPIQVCAQNCASELSGAYTGEIAVGMIQAVGGTHVIIGHSERREYFKESDEVLQKKVQLTIEAGLTPIFCVGEQLAERENGTFNETVKAQLKNTVFQLDAEKFGKIILAYETVWAIGTGKVASPQQAQDMHAFIREITGENFDEKLANSTRILYGGSCKPSNAAELFSQPDVDGGLIGGASLKADDFAAIISA